MPKKILAHIVNPVVVPETSDLYVAQPITFETMRVAKEFASGEVEVELFSAQYAEDRELVPNWLVRTPDLDRSILDVANIEGDKKLPLIRDIIDRLHQASSAEYLIYSNVDIALMPSFYLAVNQLIDRGLAAFVINRRTIPARYSEIRDIPLMFGEVGKAHPGHDCFVFQRDSYPAYILGNTCIGAGSVGRALICNLACHASDFREFKGYHLTFHLGNDRIWKDDAHTPYNDFNRRQALDCLDKMESKYGPFSEEDPVNRLFQRNRNYMTPSTHFLNRLARFAWKSASKLFASLNW